jgi:hypothetical protein
MRAQRGPTRATRAFLFVCIAAVSAAACGGNPNKATTEPSAARNITSVVAPTLTDNDVQFAWIAAQNVSSSQLQIGTSTGASNILTTDVSNGTSFDWQHAAPGNYFIRVKSTSGSTTVTSAELLLTVNSLKQVIEAFFFGTGPLALQASAQTIWQGAPRGSTYQLLVKSSLSLATVQQAIQQISSATNGQVTLTTTTIDTLPASVQGHQILVWDDLAICSGIISPGNENVIGVTCGRFVDSSGFSGGIVALSISGRNLAVELHELCHAVFIAQHIASSLGGVDTVMSPVNFNGNSNIPFSPYELAAIRAVYASSVNPFSTRAQFQAAGLVE